MQLGKMLGGTGGLVAILAGIGLAAGHRALLMPRRTLFQTDGKQVSQLWAQGGQKPDPAIVLIVGIS